MSSAAFPPVPRGTVPTTTLAAGSVQTAMAADISTPATTSAPSDTGAAPDPVPPVSTGSMGAPPSTVLSEVEHVLETPITCSMMDPDHNMGGEGHVAASLTQGNAIVATSLAADIGNIQVTKAPLLVADKLLTNLGHVEFSSFELETTLVASQTCSQDDDDVSVVSTGFVVPLTTLQSPPCKFLSEFPLSSTTAAREHIVAEKVLMHELLGAVLLLDGLPLQPPWPFVQMKDGVPVGVKLQGLLMALLKSQLWQYKSPWIPIPMPNSQ